MPMRYEIGASGANVTNRPTRRFHIASASVLAILSLRTATYSAMASMSRLVCKSFPCQAGSGYPTLYTRH